MVEPEQSSPSMWFLVFLFIGWLAIISLFTIVPMRRRKAARRAQAMELMANANASPTAMTDEQDGVSQTESPAEAGAPASSQEEPMPQLSRGFMLASLGFRGAKTEDAGLALFNIGHCDHCSELICINFQSVAPPIDDQDWLLLPLVDMPKRRGRKLHSEAPLLCEECAEAWLRPSDSLVRE